MAAPNLASRGREVAALWQSVRSIAGDDDQTVIDTVDGETDAIWALRRTVQLATEAEAHAEACKALAASYTERRKTLEDRAERYRTAVANFLQEVGEKSVRLPEGTVSWRDAAPRLIGDIPSAADLPDNCVRMVRTKHEAAIKAALADGQIIPGLSLSNGGASLTIRRA
jgi:phage gp36-like protein